MPLPADLLARVLTARTQLIAGDPGPATFLLNKHAAKSGNEPELLALRGLFLLRAGAGAQALPLFRQAYIASPGAEFVALDHHIALWHTGQHAAALQGLDAHVAAHPAHLEVLRLLITYTSLDPTNPARVTRLRELLASRTGDPVESAFTAANVAIVERRFADAIALFDRALALAPADRRGTNLLFALLYSGADPLLVRRRTEELCRAMYAGVPRGPARPVRTRPGPLRLGYLSGDFCRHVVYRFSLELLRAHRGSPDVHVTCYSDVRAEDPITARFRDHAHRFQSVAGLSDDDAAELIRRDDLDVLIDLGGHTDSARPGVLVRKPAPVQATYLGYPATTGLPEVDFRISDALADPPGITDDFCTERLWRLPRCAWAFDLGTDESPDLSVPFPCTTAPGSFAFGSFNLLTKVDPSSLALWGRAVSAAAAAPVDARLLITDRTGIFEHPPTAAAFVGEFTASGADPARLLRHSWIPDAAVHRHRLHAVDLLLDPLTYNGTTTTCEGLCYGVPTLTLPGRSHVSRVGVSLLTAAGLPEFVASDASDFVAKAVSLASDRSQFEGMRRRVRERFDRSPLRDFDTLARAIEEACRGMIRLRESETT